MTNATTMDRAVAMSMVKKNVKNKNLVKHMLATEAVLGALAVRLGQDEELWRLSGLLHDVDYDVTASDFTRHGQLGGEMLEEAGFPAELVHAVKAHNEATGVPRESLLDKALYAADPVTGLIVAAALIHPDKKLASIDVDFVMNRHKEPSFAKGANRQQMATCVELGLELKEFIGLSLAAMQGIATELGL